MDSLITRNCCDETWEKETYELMKKFVAAYDDWIDSPEFLHGELFQAMLDARDVLRGRQTEYERPTPPSQ